MISPQRILVTGGTGFVGGHVVRGLLDDGHTVGAVIRTGSARDRLDPRADACLYDGSTEALAAAVRSFAPDAVVHAATHFVAEHKPDDLVPLVEANILFGCQLLDAMRRVDVGRLVNFGTSWQHFGPGDGYRPATLYAATKQAFEDLLAFYVDAHAFRAITLKLTDTYGPGDRRAKLLPHLLAIAGTGRTLSTSPGGQVVSFVHVFDVVEAVRVALERTVAGQSAEAFAVAGDEDMPLRALVERVEAAIGRPLTVDWGAKPYRDREVMTPWRGTRLPGWGPRVTLAEGLKALVEAHVRDH